jgi:aryl-phospho-beta-D-glucosidase BglC (GH1 family)
MPTPPRPCRVILGIVFAVAFRAGGPAEAAPPSRLHADGRHLKDAEGKGVVLRGVNKPGFVDCPDGWWNAPGGSLYSGIGVWSPKAVEANLDEVRRWGCNLIRFHTCIQWWKENPTTFRDPWRSVTYEKSFREMFKQVVGLAGERGLYVIVDLYSTAAGAAAQEPLPWPPFARNPGPLGGEQDFLDLWKTMARELAPFPHVLFELFNEPHGDEAARKAWFASCQKAIEAIRQECDNPILVQWDYGCWVDLDYPPPKNPASTLDWTAKFPLRGENLVYSTHLYRNSGGGGTFARKQRLPCWSREDLRRALTLAGLEGAAKEGDRPLIVGEVGAHMKQQGEELQRELEWLRNVLEALNEWGIGYAAWAWDSQEHVEHGLLRPGNAIPAPNEAGEIIRRALAAGR